MRPRTPLRSAKVQAVDAGNDAGVAVSVGGGSAAAGPLDVIGVSKALSTVRTRMRRISSAVSERMRSHGGTRNASS